MKSNKLTFSQAIDAVKEGKPIARSGWNGKGMFVFQIAQSDIPVDHLDPTFVPSEVLDYLQRRPKDSVIFTPYLCMYNAQGEVVSGWLASQSDILADDWEIVSLQPTGI